MKRTTVTLPETTMENIRVLAGINKRGISSEIEIAVDRWISTNKDMIDKAQNRATKP